MKTLAFCRDSTWAGGRRRVLPQVTVRATVLLISSRGVVGQYCRTEGYKVVGQDRCQYQENWTWLKNLSRFYKSRFRRHLYQPDLRFFDGCWTVVVQQDLPINAGLQNSLHLKDFMVHDIPQHAHWFAYATGSHGHGSQLPHTAHVRIAHCFFGGFFPPHVCPLPLVPACFGNWCLLILGESDHASNLQFSAVVCQDPR